MSQLDRPLLAITGPTGASKSKWAEELLCADWPCLYNADAFQFYKEIPVLSNQPSADRMISYRFVADRSIAQLRNAGEYARETEPYLREPGIWVGTGLYLGATLYGLDSHQTKGTPFQGKARCPYKMIVLDPPRPILYDLLDQRVDDMLKKGAVEETRSVLKMLESGVIEESNPVLKAIGLRHLILSERHDLSFEEAQRLWKRDTRRLAKRQWTWLRKFCPPSENCLWLQELKNPKPVIERFFRDDRCSF